MYRSLYLLCSLALPVLGMVYASRADEASDAAVYMVSYIEVMPSSQGETIALLRQYREVSREEKGNRRLEVLQQNGRPDHFVLLETWKDQKALDAHGMAAHTTQWRESCSLYVSAHSMSVSTKGSQLVPRWLYTPQEPRMS